VEVGSPRDTAYVCEIQLLGAMDDPTGGSIRCRPLIRTTDSHAYISPELGSGHPSAR
jgi:hypothetical protein